MVRVHDLIRRGQGAGVFRTDISADLLASVLHHILYGAAIDVASGRLNPTDAPHFVAEMALAVCAVPTSPQWTGPTIVVDQSYDFCSDVVIV